MNQLTLERVEIVEDGKRVVAPRWSDRTITDDPRDNVAVAALCCFGSCHHVELKQLLCEFRAGILTIRGQVSSYYMKQLAQEKVRSLEGVNQIVNRLEVVLHLKKSPHSRHCFSEESFPSEHLRMSLPSTSNCDSFASLSVTPKTLTDLERVSK